MNKDARVIGAWFGRTVIKSCAKLAYSDAQAVIEGGHLPAEKIQGHELSEVEEDIQTLQSLATKMRARRFENGALKIDNPKLAFQLDSKGLPTDANPYESKDAHRLIEEFMLLANMSVAQKIAAGLPEVALLRRHDQPIDRRIEGFKSRAQLMGFKEMDISSGGALFKSLQAIDNVEDRQALETLATKSMLRAKYFCTGMVDISKYSHYALNIPLYTHFTSPIRRYADLIVHRQLEAVLAGNEKFPIEREAMAKIAQVSFYNGKRSLLDFSCLVSLTHIILAILIFRHINSNVTSSVTLPSLLKNRVNISSSACSCTI